MITVDITLVLTIINMLVLMMILNAVLYKPVQRILAQREARKASLTGDVDSFDKKARQRQEEVDGKVREASARAKAALDAARAEASAAGSAKIAAIRSEADTEKKAQLEDLRKQVQTVQAELAGKTTVFAQEMATKILGRSVQA
ncbi:MAG: hypothetical protein BWK76_21310 [Desulfobulbaceae bacterium A2]|nr:MAG: hypothetical protein BWK76_21310 [Desulfobulbaceae bacterium A2]